MRKIKFMAVASALALAAPALAVQYKFVVVDPTVSQNGVAFDGDSYSFVFDSAPIPATSTSVSFSLQGSVLFSVGGVSQSPISGDFSFQTGNSGFDTPLNSYFSEQLFTGDPSAPTFRLGTFQTDVGTITISDATAPPVPEPASWLMMIAGFGLTGAVLRSRQTRVRFAI